MNNKFSSYSDEQLVSFISHKGSETEPAFNEIYIRYSPLVHAYCVRISDNRDKAEDIFQETFIRFFNNVRTEENTNISGYLIKIARNLCLNEKRNLKSNIPAEELESLLFETNDYETIEMLELIKMALELIEFDYREAFVLKEYDRMTYEEISEICGITVANVKSRVFRAKQKIKDILAPYIKEYVK
ncbi:MAG: RNA polymerase sigma factor [Candidatus Kapabacteria bacterium]|nr:RNA polymerase sigma factor [Candidatus Kapabacteria bacterium]